MPEQCPPDEIARVRPRQAYATRIEALRARVGVAAKALAHQGIRPTVTRIRAALGGGSPNELAPALKHWRESVLPTLGIQLHGGRDAAGTTPPPQIADLSCELWQRALAAAAVELKGGPTARQIAVRTEEANSLRNQLNGVRDQLQREAVAYGELRAQAARHETIARQALARAQESELRERDLARKLGEARQRVAQLEASEAEDRSRQRTEIARSRERPRAQSSRRWPKVRKTKRRLARVKRARKTPSPAGHQVTRKGKGLRGKGKRKDGKAMQ